MARIFRWIFLAVTFAWVVLGIIGNLQTAQSTVEHRREYFQMILNIASAPPWWFPFALMLLVLGVWYWIEQGSPPWPHKAKPKEDEVYDATVKLISDPTEGPYLPISAFCKAGGQALHKRSITRVCRRLAKVKLSPFASMTEPHVDIVPKGQWASFIQRARKVGRDLEDGSEAVAAMEEWKQSGDLRPSWDMGEPIGFPTQARRISELQNAAPSPNVTVRIGHDLIDSANDPHWIRGRIKNEGNRGAEGCRVKLLSVQGQNILEPSRIENGAFEWQGGGCGPKRLDPEERLIFDIGTRRRAKDSPLVLLAFFEGNPVECNLPSPGIYTLTLGLYGANIPSKQQDFTFQIGAGVDNIKIL
jgi:hypothetical protein